MGSALIATVVIVGIGVAAAFAAMVWHPKELPAESETVAENSASSGSPYKGKVNKPLTFRALVRFILFVVFAAVFCYVMWSRHS